MGFFSVLDSSRPDLVSCAFCKNGFIMKLSCPFHRSKSQSENFKEDDENYFEWEKEGLIYLIHQHGFMACTCPMTLFLAGDNVPIVLSAREESREENKINECLYNGPEKEILIRESNLLTELFPEIVSEFVSDEYKENLREQVQENNDNPSYTNDEFAVLCPQIPPIFADFIYLEKRIESFQIELAEQNFNLEQIILFANAGYFVNKLLSSQNLENIIQVPETSTSREPINQSSSELGASNAHLENDDRLEIRCYFCGLEIPMRELVSFNSQRETDLWILHARIQPSCSHVLLHRGKHFAVNTLGTRASVSGMF